MPTINRYQRQVAPAVPSPAAAPSGAFGAQTAGTLSKIGPMLTGLTDNLVDITIDQQQIKSDAHVRSVLSEAMREANSYMTPLLQSEGVDALELHDDAIYFFEQQRRNLNEKLSTPYEMEKFAQAYDPREESYRVRALERQIQQTEAYDRSSMESMLEQVYAEVYPMRWDSAFLEESRKEADALVGRLFATADPETRAKKRSDAVGLLYSQAVEGQIKDDPDRARKYYDTVKDRIPGPYQAALEAKLRNADVRQQSQTHADYVQRAVESPTERLAWVRDTLEGAVRDATLARVKAINAEEKALLEQSKTDRAAAMAKKIIAAPGLTAATDLALDPELSGPEQLVALRLAKEIHGRGRTESDLKKLMAAKEAVENRTVKSREDLYARFGPYLTQKHMEQIIDEYERGVPSDFADSRGLALYKTLTGENADANPYEYLAAMEYLERNRPKDRAITDAEAKLILNEGIVFSKIEGETPGFLYDPNRTYAEALERGEGDQWLPFVSDEEEQQIRSIMEEHNRRHPEIRVKINDFSIRYYKRKHKLGLPTPESNPEWE